MGLNSSRQVTPLAIFLSAMALTSLFVPPMAGGTTGVGIAKLLSTIFMA